MILQEIEKGSISGSDGASQSDATNFFAFLKTKFNRLSVFYNDNDVVNRRIYMSMNNYDNDPFG
jgi:hypothetical protein